MAKAKKAAGKKSKIKAPAIVTTLPDGEQAIEDRIVAILELLDKRAADFTGTQEQYDRLALDTMALELRRMADGLQPADE